METKKRYYDDPYETEFSARVLGCAPGKGKGTWEVELEETAFYPEGGGQGADHGTLDGAAVTDVHEREGCILHTVDRPLEVGKTVTGRICWQRRFDHMQQHSGEHIVSGMLCSRFHCDNVGFHLGDKTVTIDYNASISFRELLEVEEAANRYIWEDHGVSITFYPPGAEIPAYRSKKDLPGTVRIVEFPGADRCACCGTHVSRSAQVGLVKFLSCQKFRQGTRIELVCGGRAAAYFAAIQAENQAVAQAVSAKPEQTAAAVETFLRELQEEKDLAAHLEQERNALLAASYQGRGDTLLVRQAMSPDAVRRLADALAHACGGLGAVFAGGEGRYHYALVRPDGGDLKELTGALNADLKGRGGGRGGFAQGSVTASEEEIRAFFAGA